MSEQKVTPAQTPERPVTETTARLDEQALDEAAREIIAAFAHHQLLDVKVIIKDTILRLSALPAVPEKPQEAVADDLAMMCRRLVHALRNSPERQELCAQATGLLRRLGLEGSPLRAHPPALVGDEAVDGMGSPTDNGESADGGVLLVTWPLADEQRADFRRRMDRLEVQLQGLRRRNKKGGVHISRAEGAFYLRLGRTALASPSAPRLAEVEAIEAADGALSANPDAIEVRQRFDVLMDRMDEFYEGQEMWDEQIVAFYLVQEARLHVDVLRALCGEAAQCTAEVDNDAARELTVRLNQAWRGEDPVGSATPSPTTSAALPPSHAGEAK